MRWVRVVPFLAAGLVIASVDDALAQKGVTELGVDMAFSYETESELFGIMLPGGGSAESIVGPQGAVRIGFFLSDAVSLEPATSFNLLSGDSETLTVWAFALKLQYHFNADPGRARPYLGIGPTFTLVDLGGESSSQFGLTGELGVKLPINEHVGARLAASYTRGFENDDFGSRNILAAVFGISVFLGG
jgi:opacity protein-like surface antigen